MKLHGFRLLNRFGVNVPYDKHDIKGFLRCLGFYLNYLSHSPKEIRSTCFRLFPGIFAPFRSKTHPLWRFCFRCLRLFRS